MITEKFPALFQPTKVWQRSEILQKPSPVPKVAGIYAWYFRAISPIVPLINCVSYDDLHLLYIGKANNLAKRLNTHFDGKASRSTLRRVLGSLLAEELGIEISLTKGGRWKFGVGEIQLSEWMEKNAYVVWMPHESPNSVEEEIIKQVAPPLNLKGNKTHPFYSILKAKRSVVSVNARNLPPLP